MVRDFQSFLFLGLRLGFLLSSASSRMARNSRELFFGLLFDCPPVFFCDTSTRIFLPKTSDPFSALIISSPLSFSLTVTKAKPFALPLLSVMILHLPR